MGTPRCRREDGLVWLTLLSGGISILTLWHIPPCVFWQCHGAFAYAPLSAWEAPLFPFHLSSFSRLSATCKPFLDSPGLCEGPSTMLLSAVPEHASTLESHWCTFTHVPCWTESPWGQGLNCVCLFSAPVWSQAHLVEWR